MKIAKLVLFYLLLWISIKYIKNGVPYNFTNIHKPKLIKIFNLHPKSHFLAVSIRLCMSVIFWECISLNQHTQIQRHEVSVCPLYYYFLCIVFFSDEIDSPVLNGFHCFSNAGRVIFDGFRRFFIFRYRGQAPGH